MGMHVVPFHHPNLARVITMTIAIAVNIVGRYELSIRMKLGGISRVPTKGLPQVISKTLPRTNLRAREAVPKVLIETVEVRVYQ